MDHNSSVASSNKDLVIGHLGAAARDIFFSWCPGQGQEFNSINVKLKPTGDGRLTSSLSIALHGGKSWDLSCNGLECPLTKHALAKRLRGNVKENSPHAVIKADTTLTIDMQGNISFGLVAHELKCDPPEAPLPVLPAVNHSKLNDDGYVSWIRVGLWLMHLSQVLAHVVHHGAKLCRELFLVAIKGVEEYNCEATQYRPGNPGFATPQPWIDKILTHHNQKNKSKRKVTWSNSNARKKYVAGGFWEVM